MSPRYSYPEWYTIELIRDIQLKARLHKRYKSSKSRIDYECFSQCRARVKRKIEFTHEQYRSKVELNLSKDPKSFWNFIKSKQGTRNAQTI